MCLHRLAYDEQLNMTKFIACCVSIQQLLRLFLLEMKQQDRKIQRLSIFPATEFVPVNWNAQE